MRLRGRQDIVLADVGGSATVLTVAQTEGPLQLVQLSTGLVLVEATPGEQLLRIALPPGGYLVRRVSPRGVWSREVQVVAGVVTRVEETSLTLVGEPSLAPKGVALRESRHELALAGAVLMDAYFNSWSVQAMYRWRFSTHFGLRARALVGFPMATGLAEQLLRDFGVLPSSFIVTRGILGVDIEWLAWSGEQGLVAFTLGFSLGPSFLMVGPNTGVLVSETIPAITATGTFGMHFRRVPGLAIFLEGLVYAGVESRRYSDNPGVTLMGWAKPQVNLGVAWHFG
jgi:hypothetical protein